MSLAGIDHFVVLMLENRSFDHLLSSLGVDGADESMWNPDSAGHEIHVSLVQADEYLNRTTALFIRPDCGRDDEVDEAGGLNHSPGDYSSHYVWQLAVGPDYRRGIVINDRVNRRDLAPTLVYALSGAEPRYATGHVRTQMFREEFGLPRYTATAAAKALEPKIDLERW